MAAASLMTVAESVTSILMSLYFLRLFCQGLLGHTAPVGKERWFHTERGRAVSIATTVHPLGGRATASAGGWIFDVDVLAICLVILQRSQL